MTIVKLKQISHYYQKYCNKPVCTVCHFFVLCYRDIRILGVALEETHLR